MPKFNMNALLLILFAFLISIAMPVGLLVVMSVTFATVIMNYTETKKMRKDLNELKESLQGAKPRRATELTPVPSRLVKEDADDAGLPSEETDKPQHTERMKSK